MTIRIAACQLQIILPRIHDRKYVYKIMQFDYNGNYIYFVASLDFIWNGVLLSIH